MSASSAPRLPLGLTSWSRRSRAAIAAVAVRPAGHRRRLAGAVAFVAPALLHHDVVERDARRPAGRLQAGALRALVGPAHAEVGDRIDAVGDAEQRAEVAGPVEAHPADAQPFGARGQPQVLDRARRRVDVGLGDRAAPENLAVGLAVVAADDDDRAAPRRRPRSSGRGTDGHARRSGRPGAAARAGPAGEPRRGSSASRTHDQPPRLHEPDRRRLMRGLEDPLEDVGGDLVRLGSAGCRDARRSCGRPRRARRRDSASPSGRRRARPPGSRRIPAASAGGRVGLGRTRAGTVEWRRKRGDARKPVRIRHGRATVTGSLRPGSQELARHEPLQVRDARSRGGSPDGFGSGVVRRLILVRHAPTAATRSLRVPGRRAARRARHRRGRRAVGARRAPRWCAALPRAAARPPRPPG